jgi:hypothetical protein
MKLLANLGLMLFLAFSGILTFLYGAALYEKIAKPTFKNLRTSEFAILGVIILGFLIMDYFIVRRFLRKGKSQR